MDEKIITVTAYPLGYRLALPNVWAGSIGLNEQEASDLHAALSHALGRESVSPTEGNCSELCRRAWGDREAYVETLEESNGAHLIELDALRKVAEAARAVSDEAEARGYLAPDLRAMRTALDALKTSGAADGDGAAT